MSSDSFANLWNTSVPTKPATAPRTLGGALNSSQPSAGARRPQYDAFSILASSKPTSSSSPTSPRSQTPSAVPAPAAKSVPSNGGSGDAFSGLLSGSFAGASSDAGLSIAARKAKVEAERRAALARQQEASKAQAAAWAGLDTLGTAPPITPQRAPSPPADDEWLFGSLTAKQATPATSQPRAPADAPVKHGDDWGLDDFISRPANATKPAPAPAAVARSKSVWDHLDGIDSSPAATSGRGMPARSGTPGDFDFGDREDGLLEGNSDNENDILGALGKPVGTARSSDTVRSLWPSWLTR
jgi:hypothetical protein